MRILHYSLGFPPYRTGGLTKFCMDLMVQQIKNGNKVALLWPGQMKFVLKSTSVEDHGYVSYQNADIRSYEVINPLPISYDEGISDISSFMLEGDGEPYLEFIEDYKPDVIHIHTLMGLHKNFLKAAKEKGVRLVFTAHDFFPICPKITIFRHGAICGCYKSCDECAKCNSTALGMTKIRLLQSALYRELKDSALVKKLRKQHRDDYLSENSKKEVGVNSIEDYKKLRSFYESMLEMMNIIHYNSTVTKLVYESVFNLSNSVVIQITHADIQDNRKLKTFCEGKLRIRYLGAQGGAKGFFCSRRHSICYGELDKILS